MNAPNPERALARAVMRSVDDTTPGGFHRISLRGLGSVLGRIVVLAAAVNLLLLVVYMVAVLGARIR